MYKIWIVDAFTDKPYAGNPAAVMVVPDFPEDLLSIAAEMNLSETAFVKHLEGNRFHIRWFTPLVEVKLCGHATLATAQILFQENRVSGDVVTFESLSGSLHVRREENGLILDLPLQKISKELDTPAFAAALNLPPEDIIEVVQSFDDAIVVLKEESLVVHLRPEFDKIARVDARALIITAAGQTFDCVSRFFAPRVGINEDPVTGSAHCKLAHYWSQKLQKSTLHAYQASPRGGSLFIQVQGDRVFLKGQAVTIMEGTWKVKLK